MVGIPPKTVQAKIFFSLNFLLAFQIWICNTHPMEQIFRYRGKNYTRQDINFIRQFIADNPDSSRRALSIKLCEAWGWVQTNGALRDQVCRSFMLALHREGYIHLPPRRQTPHNPLANRKKPEKVIVDETSVKEYLAETKPLKIIEVRRGRHEKLCNSLIEQYHYLGYTQPVGEHLKYMIYSGNRPIACMTWSSPPRHIGCRDKFIGWSKPVREQNLHYMAYNSRFLILPWVQVKFLASHLLSMVSRQISKDWRARYEHGIYYLETFVDKERFAGTSYRAANWIYLGDTTGRGKNDQTGKKNRSIKAVYGYPLTYDFRDRLCGRKNVTPRLKKLTGTI